ncbi:thiamine phosphate synthase [Aurantiacibacter spongiae]|uniref:Thiamine phosphate synthase n=1 Tax=Aurantiacibacter spongiae TaxID=2488860 RepID=A0A3N5CVS3_9SPHN|nr:thiamine phosphate synthase [Aurantiacibacter spongiae]RPF71590.1 thiamine phosphate synthase [Aurantiacibacter spongiae]
MASDQPLPRLWLLSDARNDALLEQALARLPRGSGFVFRHYHLAPGARLARFRRLARLCRSHGHLTVLADSTLTAREWGADGVYGSPRSLAPRRRGLLAIATVHDIGEIAQANRVRADAVMLSPVFPTRSHAGTIPIGPLRFRLLARRAQMPVIALGGMTAAASRRLGWPRWAAIDGLSVGH